MAKHDDELDQLLTTLKLKRIGAIVGRELAAAEKAHPSCRDFLARLLRDEVPAATIRQLFHRTPHRIHAHVRLCVLALLLERVAALRAKDTWRNLLATLETVKVVEYERGGTRVRQTSEVRSDVAGVLRTLHVPLPPVQHKVAPVAPSAQPSESALAAPESAASPVEPSAG